MTDRNAQLDGTGRSLEELLGMARELVPRHATAALDDARERAAAGLLNLVVLGEFKRGKSTLVNALLERPLLPTGVVPLTSIVTIVRASDRDRLLVRFADDSEREEPLEKLRDYVTEAGNPHNRRGVELVLVEAETGVLGQRIQLVDTPGLASVHEHNTEAARRFLPRIDAALGVLAADQPLTSTERDFLTEAAADVPRLIVVVNRIDALARAAELEESLGFIRQGLAKALPNGHREIFPVSALRGEGLHELRQRLLELAHHEGDEIQRESLRRAALRLALETAQAARFQIATVRLPIDELERRSRLFERKLEELEQARMEASDLLEQGLARLLRERVDEPLEALVAQRAEPLSAELHDFASTLPARPRDQYARRLEEWVDERIRREFDELVPSFERAVGSGLAELEEKHALRVRDILEDLAEAARDVFGEQAAVGLPESGLRERPRFSFKLRDVRHALDQLVTVGRRSVPGPLGRRLVLRDAEIHLTRMLDRHAGRLRSELKERARDTVRDYNRDLGRLVVDALDALREALARAAEERGRGEDAVRFRVAELERVESRCDQIAGALERAATNEAAATEVS